MGEGQGELEVPGAVDIYTFTPEETDAYFFASLSVSDNNAPQWKATDANGETLFEGAGLWLGGHPGEMTLDAGMTYTITVYAAHGAYGEYAFQVWRVPEPDVIAPIAVGDSVFAEMNDPDDGAGNIEAPGAVDRYTLQVRRAQSVTFLAVEGSDEGSLTWTVVAPDGTPVFENEGLWSGNELGPFRLTQGDYTIYVGGENGATGTYRFDVRGG
jgi:hypothetical protein